MILLKIKWFCLWVCVVCRPKPLTPEVVISSPVTDKGFSFIQIATKTIQIDIHFNPTDGYSAGALSALGVISFLVEIAIVMEWVSILEVESLGVRSAVAPPLLGDAYMAAELRVAVPHETWAVVHLLPCHVGEQLP